MEKNIIDTNGDEWEFVGTTETVCDCLYLKRCNYFNKEIKEPPFVRIGNEYICTKIFKKIQKDS